MRYFIALKILLTAALLGWLISSGCGSGGTGSDEEKARAIYQRAQELQAEGKSLEAMTEYDNLAGYKETRTYMEAQAALLKQGLAVGGARAGWTIKKMFDIKNDLLSQGRDIHPDGDAVAPLREKDAWGNYMWIEYSTDPRYTFAVFSSGPDGRQKTPDDLALYNHRTFQGRTPPVGASAPAPVPPLEPAPTVRPEPPKQPPPAGRPGETAVELDELLKDK
ncbi:MAG: hypothetical protein AB1896_02945 [Thermodesulfobacteriota bacterium]